MQYASNSVFIEQSPFSHDVEGYASYLNSFNNNNRSTRLQNARRFARFYPDLAEWQRGSLIDRIGSYQARRGTAYCCAAARPYLYFLVQRGLFVLDWPWIIGTKTHVLPMARLPQLVQKFSIKLCEQLLSLGYQPGATDIVERAVRYFFIRYGIDVVNVGEPELTDFEFAMASFQKRDDAFFIYKSPEQLRQNFRELKLMLFIFRTALYHQSRINDPPKRKVPVPTSLQVKPAIQHYIARYCQARLDFHTRPGTVDKFKNAGRHLADWLATHYPEIESFAELTREQVLAYSASLISAGINLETHITRLSSLSVMFHDTTAWGWPDGPFRPLIGARDLPKRPNRIPRFIPAHELDRLMPVIGVN